MKNKTWMMAVAMALNEYADKGNLFNAVQATVASFPCYGTIEGRIALGGQIIAIQSDTTRKG